MHPSNWVVLAAAGVLIGATAVPAVVGQEQAPFLVPHLPCAAIPSEHDFDDDSALAITFETTQGGATNVCVIANDGLTLLNTLVRELYEVVDPVVEKIQAAVDAAVEGAIAVLMRLAGLALWLLDQIDKHIDDALGRAEQVRQIIVDLANLILDAAQAAVGEVILAARHHLEATLDTASGLVAPTCGAVGISSQCTTATNAELPPVSAPDLNVERDTGSYQGDPIIQLDRETLLESLGPRLQSLYLNTEEEVAW